MDNLYHLLLSSPDAISPLTGLQLITNKVYELAVQANAFGASFNLYNHNTTFAETVLNNWPSSVKLTFIGSNIGRNVQFGAELTTQLDLTVNPVAYAFNKSVGYNVTHATWDATAMYYAIRGLDDVYAYNFTSGSVVADSTAGIIFNTSNTAVSSQNSVIFKQGGIGNNSFAARLEDMLLWQPGDPVPSSLAVITACPASNSTTAATGTGTVSGSSAAPTIVYTGTASSKEISSMIFLLCICLVFVGNSLL